MVPDGLTHLHSPDTTRKYSTQAIRGMDWGWKNDETWIRSAGRDYLNEESGIPTNGPVSTLLRNTKETGLPLQTHTLREFGKHLNDLKKENFSLKLRIYFLEERIQQKYDDSNEDIYKRNIELKVEVESLKRELNVKAGQLEKATKAVEKLSNQNEADIHQKYEEKQQETEHVQAILQNKIQLLQEESRLAKNEMEKMTAILQTEKLRSLELEKKLNDCNWENQENIKLWETNERALMEKDRIIDQLTQELRNKDTQIDLLRDENHKVVDHHIGDLDFEELIDSPCQKGNEDEELQSEVVREKLRTQQEMQLKLTEHTVSRLTSQKNNEECFIIDG